jgi:hypothetical protein
MFNQHESSYCAQRAIPVSVVSVQRGVCFFQQRTLLRGKTVKAATRMSSSTLLCRFHFQEFISITVDNPSSYKYVVRKGNRILTATWITTGYSPLLTAKMSLL